MLKHELLYNNLNSVSNNEFENILKIKSPIEEYLNIKLEKNVKEYLKKNDENNYIIKDNSDEEKNVFIKYITLVDFLKYLTGKYKNENLDTLPENENKNLESKYQKYIHDKNNYAYVDSVFYYISSKLKNDNNFLHGIECYDTFICQKKKCRINISDDLEYLCDSNYFTQNLGKKFYFEDNEANDIFQQNKKDILNIDDTIEISLYDIENIDICDCDIDIDISNVSQSLNSVNDILLNENEDDESDEKIILKYNHNNNDTINNCTDSDEEYEEESDEESVEESDEEIDEESDEEIDEESDEESEEESEEEKMYLLLNKFPTQVVVIEKCENTLDELLEEGEIKLEELESAIFQIITTLFLYQKKYNFTHNDLHTNNIMYSNTTIEYLIYKIDNKYYKIPTFGKIYKIIDFGRSIYSYNDKPLCSDSFSKNGTAHTQYNFKPYYNEKKAVIEPNMSFDLCRLACSIFDFVCDDINNIDEYRSTAPVYDLIFSWLYDDNKLNVLYKSNGDDKYPGFKLYKMISKIVHNHIPKDQYNHKVMQKFLINEYNKEEPSNKDFFMDIDDM